MNKNTIDWVAIQRQLLHIRVRVCQTDVWNEVRNIAIALTNIIK